MICNAGLAESTQSQYSYVFKSFSNFCSINGHRDSFIIPVTLGIEFLTALFQEGKSYSSVNTARSTLSQLVTISGEGGIDFGSHPLVVKFMKGVFKLRPALPRYTYTWDVGPVLDFLQSSCNRSSPLKTLSIKCVTLVALSTGHRVQTLASLSVENIVHLKDKLVLHIPKVLKTTRPGNHITVELYRFNENQNLCPVLCLQSYLDRTSPLRNQDLVFISFQKPHQPVSTQTLSRWICSALEEAGIPQVFKAHSVRGAATSKAAEKSNIDAVLKAAGWSSSRSFDKFYKKPILPSRSIVNAVLKH